MAILNEAKNELYLKIVFVGPSGSGKTESFKALYRETADKSSPPLSQQNSQSNEDSILEFLPLAIGETEAHFLRLHLYTVSQYHCDSLLAPLLFKGVDGIVFTADARLHRIFANQKALEAVRRNLFYSKENIDEIPMVTQLTHCDSPQGLSVEEFKKIKTFKGYPVFPSYPKTGENVMKTLERLVEIIIDKMRSPSEVTEQSLKTSQLIQKPTLSTILQ